MRTFFTKFITRYSQKAFIVFLLGISLFSYMKIFAIGSPYQPGETFDPACVPSEVNCVVQIIPSQTGNAKTLLYTDGTLTAWSTNLYWDSGASRLGIGTATPGAKLDVNGDALINTLTVGLGSGSVSTNTALGVSALGPSTTGGSNTSIGYQTLLVNTSGNSNTAVGGLALGANTTGSFNVGIGTNTLLGNNTGSQNVAVGSSALRFSTASFNTAVGTSALFNDTTGATNTAVGNNAMSALTTASDNTAIGVGAGQGITTGGSNTAIGRHTIFTSNTATNNTALGYFALSAVTGSNNTGLGYRAGDAISSGSNNLIIGYDVDAPSPTGSNQLSIGNLIFGTGVDGTGTTVSSGSVGIGTNAPSSKLDLTTNSLGVTQTATSGLALVNTTAATLALQQISPAVRWSAQGWRTASGGASEAVDFRAYVLPEGNVSHPTGTWQLQSSVNGGAFSNNFIVKSTGEVGIAGGIFSGYNLAVTGSIRTTGDIRFIRNATQIDLRTTLVSGGDKIIEFPNQSGTLALLSDLNSFTLSNGSGTTANGTAIDLGGNLTNNAIISGNTFGPGFGSNFKFYTGQTGFLTEDGHNNTYIGDVDSSHSTGDGIFVVHAENGNSTAYYRNADDTGHFGINTDSPFFPLHVVGVSYFDTFPGDPALPVYISADVQVGGETGLYSSDGDQMMVTYKPSIFTYYYANGDILVDSSGGTGDAHVGINNASPSVALDVVGEVKISSSLYLLNNTWDVIDDGGTTTNEIGVSGASGRVIVGDGLGNVGIDLNGAAGLIQATSLSGTGSRAVLADASGFLSAPVSDRSVKQNIQTLDYGLDTLMQLNPVSFEYIHDWKNYGQGKQIGFIAQEIATVLPNSAFTTPKTGKMGYNEIDLVPVAVKAIQEMNIKIQGLSSLDTSNSNSLGSLVKGFLADIGNGLESLFVKKIHTEELCVKKSDGNDICVTGDQLEQLLRGSNTSNNNDTGAGDGGDAGTDNETAGGGDTAGNTIDGGDNNSSTSSDTGGLETPSVESSSSSGELQP